MSRHRAWGAVDNVCDENLSEIYHSTHEEQGTKKNTGTTWQLEVLSLNYSQTPGNRAGPTVLKVTSKYALIYAHTHTHAHTHPHAHAHAHARTHAHTRTHTHNGSCLEL